MQPMPENENMMYFKPIKVNFSFDFHLSKYYIICMNLKI